MGLKRSSVVLLIVVLLLFVPVVINRWGGTIELDNNLIQAINFALVLAGIFLGAHYELQRLNHSFREERNREARHQRLQSLKRIESWLEEIGSACQQIAVLYELSDKDETGKLRVNFEKLRPIEESLLHHEMQLFIVGSIVAPLNDSDLDKAVTTVFNSVIEVRRILAERKLIDVRSLLVQIALALQAINNTRDRELQQT